MNSREVTTRIITALAPLNEARAKQDEAVKEVNAAAGLLRAAFAEAIQEGFELWETPVTVMIAGVPIMITYGHDQPDGTRDDCYSVGCGAEGVYYVQVTPLAMLNDVKGAPLQTLDDRKEAPPAAVDAESNTWVNGDGFTCRTCGKSVSAAEADDKDGQCVDCANKPYEMGK